MTLGEMMTDYELRYIEANKEWEHADEKITMRYADNPVPQETTLLDATATIASHAYIEGVQTGFNMMSEEFKVTIKEFIDYCSEYIDKTYGFGKDEFICNAIEFFNQQKQNK